MLLPSYRRFPPDDEFQRDLAIKDLYNFRSRSYWLRRLENYDRKERVPVDEYTIEHILPQNPQLSAQWKADLGPEWERIQNTWLHTLSNLTLIGHKPELSDRPFIEKRDMEGGFAGSPLRVNQGLGKLDHWTEDTIKERAARLASQAIAVWSGPSLQADILEAYKPLPAARTGIALPIIRFWLPVPCARCSTLSASRCSDLTPASLAETNFVDVVPQAKRLRLSLNLTFPEIQDPKGICRDVSGLGRWGNGDVEVGLAALEDLPYVMGLVRQSFEKQMGNGADA